LINKAVARRYAQALLMIAVEKDSLGQFQEQLESIVGAIISDEKALLVINNPRIQPEEKKAYLKQYFNSGVSATIVNFVNLIVDKKRESFFLDIVKEYARYADEVRNIVNAEVRSAVQLTDKDFRDIESRLAKHTGKNVRLNMVIDTSLLGGIVVKIGETVIDGSVVKRLALLKHHLRQSQFEGIGVNK